MQDISLQITHALKNIQKEPFWKVLYLAILKFMFSLKSRRKVKQYALRGLMVTFIVT